MFDVYCLLLLLYARAVVAKQAEEAEESKLNSVLLRYRTKGSSRQSRESGASTTAVDAYDMYMYCCCKADHQTSRGGGGIRTIICSTLYTVACCLTAHSLEDQRQQQSEQGE